MTGVRISGIPGLDGDYELDLATLKNKDFRRIKQMSGVRALEMEDALGHGDNDVIVAFAAIGLERAGRRFLEDQLWDAPLGSITFIGDEEEAEAEAKDPTQSDQPSSEPPSDETTGPSSSPIGNGIPTPSTQNGTGTEELETSAESETPSVSES